MSSMDVRLVHDAVTYAVAGAVMLGIAAAALVGIDSAGPGEMTPIVGVGLLYAMVGLVVGTLVACARWGRPPEPDSAP